MAGADALSAGTPSCECGRSGEARLRRLAEAHLDRTAAANRAFFEAEAGSIAQACSDMAVRFRRGARLLVAGGATNASDAFHVSVEFLHPVLVGKRALPALALDVDPAARLAVLGRPEDIGFGIASGHGDEAVAAMLAQARRSGMLTIGLSGAAAALPDCDHVFRVPDDNPMVVQEVQETCYHVLYELVHLFLEREDLP